MEEVSAVSFGNSLQVPNVQALAAALDQHSNEIPNRYIRPEAETDEVVGHAAVDELPVIDLNRLLSPEFSEDESAKLGLACQDWGFFQLINHGVPEELINEMKTDVTEFFKLPLNEKQAYAQLPNSLEGYGQAFVLSEEQKLDWGDMMYIVTRPPATRNMRFWPNHPPTYRDTLDKYSWALKQVASCLLGFMAKNLGIDPEVILSKFEDEPQAMRINYYPPCPKAADKVLGLSPHTDATLLTLLLQVSSDVQGLQIRKNHRWFPVDPLPGAFIVNIGDILEILSNGIYKSIEHRAIVNPDKERLSVGTFHGPSNGITVGPLPELLSLKGSKAQYKSMSYANYMKTYFSAKLDGKSLLESIKQEK